MFLTLLVTLSIAACGAEKQKTASNEDFKPSLDTASAPHINIAGGYSNFEALEAEFDRFNEYYPNAKLEFTKIDVMLFRSERLYPCEGQNEKRQAYREIVGFMKYEWQ